MIFLATPYRIRCSLFRTLTPVPSAFHRSQGVLQLAHNPSGVLQRRVCGGLWHPAPDAPERGSGGRAKEAGHQLCTAERWEGIQVEEDDELQTANKTDRGHGNQIESPTQMMADKSPRRQPWAKVTHPSGQYGTSKWKVYEVLVAALYPESRPFPFL